MQRRRQHAAHMHMPKTRVLLPCPWRCRFKKVAKGGNRVVGDVIVCDESWTPSG